MAKSVARLVQERRAAHESWAQRESQIEDEKKDAFSQWAEGNPRILNALFRRLVREGWTQKDSRRLLFALNVTELFEYGEAVSRVGHMDYEKLGFNRWPHNCRVWRSSGDIVRDMQSVADCWSEWLRVEFHELEVRHPKARGLVGSIFQFGPWTEYVVKITITFADN